MYKRKHILEQDTFTNKRNPVDVPMRISYQNSLNTDGYYIFNNAIEISDTIYQHLKKEIDKKGKPIFNNNEKIKHNDNKRLQCNRLVNKPLIHIFINNLYTFIRDNITTCLIPSKFVILKSLHGCQQQSAHTDYIPAPDLESVIVSGENIPLLMIVSLMDNTKLYVWKKSIGLIFEKNIKEIATIKPTVLTLNKGDILIFRADLIHAGSDYNEENIRLHTYLDNSSVHRDANKTYIISKTDLKNVIIL